MGKSNILQRRKKCLIFNFQDVQIRGRDKILSAPPARQENYCESNQTYFGCSFDKAFHLPDEFQAKLFFTRNWVGGFYWDCAFLLDTEANVRKWNCTQLCFVYKSIGINFVRWRTELAAIL